MTDQHNNAFSEKAKQIEISMKYTGGDMEKAKSMASNQYFDIIALKGKFFAPGIGHSGVFIAFFNTAEEYISDITTVLSLNRNLYDNIRVFDDWKLIYTDILSHRESGDSVDAETLSDFLLDSFIENDLFPDVQEGNLDNLSRSVTQILEKSFNGKIQAQVETENTSSLQLEMAGVNIDQPEEESEDQPQAAPQDEAPKQQLSPEDERMNAIEAEAKYVVEGKIIVSPVKGKYINDIAPGEKIKLLLSTKDPVSSKILKVLNAIDEDKNVSAIKGRVKEKIPYPGGGYVLYALVAKGVLAKIVEEENVKIQVDRPQGEEQADSKPGDGKFILLMAVFVALIIILGIILFNLV